MKTIAHFVIAAALILVATYAQADGKNPKKDAKRSEKLAVSFVPAERNAIMVFFGNNAANERVNIRIRNSAGELVYVKTSTNAKHGIKYLFYESQKGTYTITVSKGSREYFTKKLEVI